jgi:CRISPR system Cascade subunit CasD
MQAWGDQTQTIRRPVSQFPTLSGLVGFVGCCLGTKHDDYLGNLAVYQSLSYAARQDQVWLNGKEIRPTTITDFKTAKINKNLTYDKAHKVQPNMNALSEPWEMVDFWKWDREHCVDLRTVLVYNDFMCDSTYTVLLYEKPDAPIPFDLIADALACPLAGPYMGRMCCLPHDNYMRGFVEADDVFAAFKQIAPMTGWVLTDFKPAAYTHESMYNDVPTFRAMRKLGRKVWVSHMEPQSEAKDIRDMESF